MKNCKPLTDEQLKSTNGCGSSAWFAWPFRIPRWLVPWFYLGCARHDRRYSGKLDFQVVDVYPHFVADGDNKYSMIQKMLADDELYNAWYFAIYHEAPWWLMGVLCWLADFGYWCLNTRVSRWCFDRAVR